MRWEKEIKKAIKGHKNLRLSYDGQQRIVSPHIFGRSAAHHPLLSVYQLKNLDDPSIRPDWRSFDVSKITSVEVLDEELKVRRDYNPGDKNFEEVISQV